MSSFALTDCRVEVNAVVLSAFGTSVNLPIEYDQLDDTAFGDTAHSRLGGLQDSTIGIEFNQDFVAGGPDATIWAAKNTVVAIKVRPTSSAISATNPEYVGSYLVAQYQPFGNSVGELAKTSVSWPLSDSDGIARNTS